MSHLCCAITLVVHLGHGIVLCNIFSKSGLGEVWSPSSQDALRKKVLLLSVARVNINKWSSNDDSEESSPSVREPQQPDSGKRFFPRRATLTARSTSIYFAKSLTSLCVLFVYHD